MVKLLQVCKGSSLELQIYLASGLGLRISEVLGLTWDNIDFIENTITINKITVRDNMIVLFAIKLEDKANLIFACSKNIKNISMNNLLKDSITLIDGRGGGSNFLAQGGGKNSSNLEGTMEYALRKINTL